MPAPASYKPPGDRSGQGSTAALRYLMEDLRRKPLPTRPRVLQADSAHSMIIGPVMERGQNIKPGARVTLAGVAHELTVRVVAGEFAYCEWTEAGELKQGTFTLASLSPLPEPPRAAEPSITR